MTIDWGSERVLSAAPQEAVSELVERCHRELRGSRGAVLTVASFDAKQDTMSWLGIGNVDAFLVRSDREPSAEAVAHRGGTVGYKLPPLYPRRTDDACVVVARYTGALQEAA